MFHLEPLGGNNPFFKIHFSVLKKKNLPSKNGTIRLAQKLEVFFRWVSESQVFMDPKRTGEAEKNVLTIQPV